MVRSLPHQVACFVAEEAGYPLRKIKAETTLLGDIGIDGDDADEFFEAYAKRFHVDLTGIDLSHHFQSEVELLAGPVGCLLALSNLFWRRKPDARDVHETLGKTPIHVADLIAAAGRGRWMV